MRDGSPLDLPILEPSGTPLPEPPAHGLRFSRSYRAPLDEVLAHWREPGLRRRWITPVNGSRFTLLLAAPAYLEAEEHNGAQAVRIITAFEDDGELTTVRVRIAAQPPLTKAALIANGYTDRWEERLYAFADLLHA